MIFIKAKVKCIISWRLDGLGVNYISPNNDFTKNKPLNGIPSKEINVENKKKKVG